ncbi:nucleoporin 88-like isoform X2 [Dreissena polymorpha]|uniref:nucleoporin 88-like isoform X2 n=1 Tax=Dreissena polymorpha TaxID=45954 RepID=UPI002264EC0C|nr:nucleoporin 88-like isoform X2 [Dreissena polymorpha]
MASVDKWRTCLNEKSFCKFIRENNANESNRKAKTEAKCLIAVNDYDLFIWDNASCHLIYFKLQNIDDCAEKRNRNQILLCTDPPRFDVDCLVWNLARTHLALWGQLGVTVLELPQKWGKYAEFHGGKDTVTCKCVSVGEHYFSIHAGVRLLHVAWHPGSTGDTHIVFLTSDNIINVYDILDPERPTQTLYLGDGEPSIILSQTRPSTSCALGDNVVCFDFGPPVEVFKNAGSMKGSKGSAGLTVWPLYCVRGNGDVIVAYSDLAARPTRLAIQGPLLMFPPADDNYGTDACSILCLQTTPTVVAMATCDGKLYHCVLLPRDLEETTLQSQSSQGGPMEEACLYCPPEELLLYVNETVELELSLSMPQFTDNPAPEDMFTCPLRLIKDTSSPDRYHCTHAAGVHTVALPWVNHLTDYCTTEEDEDVPPAHQQSVVEHLICTRPLPNSPPSPVLGLAQVKDTSIGTILLTLTSDLEFQCLRLSNVRYSSGEKTTLSSATHSRTIPSPLRRISKEPFDEVIRRLLQRNTSNPLIKSRSSTELSQQECYQLLTRATQVFSEEYIQKQELARHEINRRAAILREHKDQQLGDLSVLLQSRDSLSENAERLAGLCEECKETQEDLMKRLEGVMRKLQSRIPFLSESERNMKRELENIEERLETYQRSLEQLKVKRMYQQRQIQNGSQSNRPSPIIKKTQAAQLREG